ncbi:hypothetical protein PGT21_005760 [Puccinia graminis f. sp. tritici]|uniref:Uncharacterized protein n=1 Tax=Puccinia graminis f. sp. tritici TaxID=56615 RepID=A0A5B0M5A1_PUCGR|nr:hypothetical protein PGT21_005760 [Puccinia graminis f. sp. tritici]
MGFQDQLHFRGSSMLDKGFLSLMWWRFYKETGVYHKKCILLTRNKKIYFLVDFFSSCLIEKVEPPTENQRNQIREFNLEGGKIRQEILPSLSQCGAEATGHH